MIGLIVDEQSWGESIYAFGGKIIKNLEELRSAEVDDDNDISHHGIKGQQWGVRNGPPYPLGAGGDTIANGNAVRLKDYKGNAYFISQEKLDGKTLNPRVPRNYLTKNGYEDSETPRISFAPTIDQCLAGLSQNVEGNTYYVYQPKNISKCQVYKPNTKAVPDSSITGELWITNPTELTRVTKIKVTGNRGTDGKEYSYGDKKAVLFDDWTYEETD